MDTLVYFYWCILSLPEGSQSKPVNFGDVIKNWCTQCDGCWYCYSVQRRSWKSN